MKEKQQIIENETEALNKKKSTKYEERALFFGKKTQDIQTNNNAL